MKTARHAPGTMPGALQAARFLLIDGHHTDASHHAAQLEVGRTLVEQAVPVPIGLEMYCKAQQVRLDGWVSGDINASDLETIYLGNWNFPCRFYRRIFIYPRDKRIPMAELRIRPSGDIQGGFPF
ncbi:MAG: ChaN family lipoprotein [Desulfosarcina sp.]